MLNQRTSITNKFWIAIPVLGLLIFISFGALTVDTSTADDIDEIDALIDDFQEAYSNKEIAALRNLFCNDAVVATDFQNGETQRVHSIEDWLQGTRDNTFENNDNISDTLSNRQIEVYRNIAYAVCDYRYVSDTEIGIGIDIFTFLKMRGDWKIISLQYTGDEEAR